MRYTRREFQKLAFGSTAWGTITLSIPQLPEQQLSPVPFEPFAAQIARLLASLEMLGTPLSQQDKANLKAALRSESARAREEAVRTVVGILAKYVLMEVELNPEMRISVKRGAAVSELYQGGWRTFLVKVFNQAGTTPILKIKSPQGAPVGRHSSLAITGVHDFTNGAVDEVEARARWLAVSTFDAPPMTPALSGVVLEYRIVQLYSRDSGEREATLLADGGYGEQDLGYRSSLPILFHCLPAHKVTVQISDERGKASIASVLSKDGLGRVYPPQTKRQMPDMNFQPQVYRYNGESLLLPAGSYIIEYGRGPEYILKRASLEVTDSGALPLRLHLERWITPSQHGYYSGDTHIHAAGCAHYESPTEGVTPIVMERQVDGEALDLGSVLNWGPGFEYQKQFFTGHSLSVHHAHDAESTVTSMAMKNAPVPDASAGVAETPQKASSSLPGGMDRGTKIIGMAHDSGEIAEEERENVIQSLQYAANAPGVRSLVRYDIETSGFPCSHCGHLVLLRLQKGSYPGTNTIDDWPSWNMPVVQWAKAQGAIVGYAHSAHGLVVDDTALPNYVMPPFNSMGANEFIADVTHEGAIDFISGCDLWPFAELNIWYHTLNCGYRTAFAGETDFPCLTDACVGGGRSYAPLSAAPEGDDGYARWLEALLYGDSYFGDGRSHLFNFTVAGKRRNKEPVELDASAVIEVTAEICARLGPQTDEQTRLIQHASSYSKPYWHIERARMGESRRVPVELIMNGQTVDRTEIEADGSIRSVRFRVPVRQSSWLALRIYPSSHTNPVFVIVAGKPVRASRTSAVWCRAAVDVCWQQKNKRIRPSELSLAAAVYEHAREAYDRIIAESEPGNN